MPDRPKAIFISYAREDTAAAHLIAEGLRNFGIEVWFDQSELAGGDAWDKKIRDQIKACALFVPIISANTQSRTEGYFRLEWRLAEQRTHLMAKGRPFLLPIVVDDTPDSGAHVPDAFLEVQWSRFPGGQCDEKFAARVARLLDWDGSPAQRLAAISAPSASAPRHRRSPALAYGVVTAIVIAVGAAIWIATRPSENTEASPPNAELAAPALREADQLVARARALLDDDPLMTRRNVELAEQLALQAVAADSTSAEANAAVAWANFRYLDENYEDTPERRADLRRYAESAKLLDPDSVNAELAMCGVLIVTNERSEALERLAALSGQHPDNFTVLRTLAWATLWVDSSNWGGGENAMPAAFQRLRDFSPLGRSYADSLRAGTLWTQGKYAEADKLLDDVFSQGQPVRASYLIRLLILAFGWGDLDRAEAFLQTVPDKLLLEDVFIAHVSSIRTELGEYDRALATLDRTQREVLREALVEEPTALYRGNVLSVAGRPNAAKTEWRAALEVIDRRLEEQPRDVGALRNKVDLLARLGETKNAAQQFALLNEITNPAEGTIPWGSMFVYFVRTGDFDGAIPRLDCLIARDFGRWPNVYNALRHEPDFAEFRKDPRVQAIMARAAGWMAEMRAAAGLPPDPTVVTDLTAAPANAPDPESQIPQSAPADKSVAVLAFANLSEDKDNEYFSDGISEELLNVLAKIPGLKVTARTSAFFFKDKQVPIADIAQQLGVAYIVEGSVRKAGNRVRISAQLIKASDGFQMWTDQFDRELKDIFAVQDEIAGLVAQQLQLKLGVTKAARVVDPEAYQLVLKGRHFWTLRGDANFAIAEEAYRRALELDPNFAEAYAGLADVWMSRAWFRLMADGGPAVAEDLERATNAVQRATELDPGLAEPYATLGAVRHIQGRFAEVEAPFARALELNPNCVAALHWHATHAMAVGRFEASLEELRLATRLDPLAPMPLWALAANLNYIGAAEEAFDAADRALQLRPGFVPLLAEKAVAAWSSGRRDEALAAARAIAADHSESPQWWADAYAIFILRQIGHLDEAQQLMDRVFATVPAGDYRRVFALAALGRMDEALDSGSDVPSTALQPLIASPMWDPVREDPRFHSLVEKLGISREYGEGRATLERMRRQNNPGR